MGGALHRLELRIFEEGFLSESKMTPPVLGTHVRELHTRARTPLQRQTHTHTHKHREMVRVGIEVCVAGRHCRKAAMMIPRAQMGIIAGG